MGDDAGPRSLVGLEISAVCFVRDYVELHFDGPVLRALSRPFGLYGCLGWRFPEGNSPTVMRYYIGKAVDGVELIRPGPDRAWPVLGQPGRVKGRPPRPGCLPPGLGAPWVLGCSPRRLDLPQRLWIPLMIR